MGYFYIDKVLVEILAILMESIILFLPYLVLFLINLITLHLTLKLHSFGKLRL